jgi:hypothetical protein
VNQEIDVQFNIPIDPTTVTMNNVYVTDQNSNHIAAALSMPQPNVIRLKPSADLIAGTTSTSTYYYTNITSAVKGTNGVAFPGALTTYYFYTSTSSTRDTTTPTATFGPPNNAQNMGLNTKVRISFSKQFDQTTVNANTVQLLNGSTPLLGYFAIDTSNTPYQDLLFTTYAPLPANTTLTINVNGVDDLEGNPVVASSSFTTGNAPDYTQPTVVSSSVDVDATNIPLNASFRMDYSKTIDLRTVVASNVYVYDYDAGTYPSINMQPDTTNGLYVIIKPKVDLLPSTHYQICSNFVQDLAGNVQVNFCSGLFTTGTLDDTTPPTVQYMTPADASTGVPVNALLQVIFDKPVQPSTFTQITLTTNSGATTIPVTVTSDTGGLVANILPSVLLSPGTTYTLTVTGVEDMAGNVLATPTSATFTTGATDDLIYMTVAGSSPVNGATGVLASTTSVTVTFSAPVDPKMMYQSASYVPSLRTTSNGVIVPTNFSLSTDRKTLTLTLQSGSLTGATQYEIYLPYAGYPNGAYDWAGNPIYPNLTYTVTFTTQ